MLGVSLRMLNGETALDNSLVGSLVLYVLFSQQVWSLEQSSPYFVQCVCCTGWGNARVVFSFRFGI